MQQNSMVNKYDVPNDDVAWIEALKTKLPRVMREQLTHQTLSRAYFLLAMLSDEPCVHQLRDHLHAQYQAVSTSTTAIEQALLLTTCLQQSQCDPNAPFKYRLPHFLGEYPVHSKVINQSINQFNELIEAYYEDRLAKPLEAIALDHAYQNVLLAIKNHHMGCNINNLWQLLKAMSAWSSTPIEELLTAFSCLLSPSTLAEKPLPISLEPLPAYPVACENSSIPANNDGNLKPFTSTFDYQLNEAGEIEKSTYLIINGFALKPGGHADALTKHTPDFLPWKQWQCNIRRQLSQLIDVPFDEDFFNWLQIVLERLGVEFIALNTASYECYVSPFLKAQMVLSTVNEEMILGVLHESCKQAPITIEATHYPILSRYLIRFLQRFQYHRGQALGIGANWGGAVSDSNEAGADAFRLNDSLWAFYFRNLSTHRQGPAEALMNASKGITYELEALLSSFEYMTKLQPSEYSDALYNALVDNLMTGLFPEPSYFENEAYIKYRRHYVISATDKDAQTINFFYQPDPQGTYFKTKDGRYKQTPMFRQAGSLVVESFPRDTGSGECFQSSSAANPLWPLQLQYAQCNTSSIRGHIIYNPIAPNEFLPDAYYGQLIQESEDVFVPFIGVIPKNFDKHFNQVELCASFVIRMLHSSRLMAYCPLFIAYYFAIATRFLPSIEAKTPLFATTHFEIKRKWQALDDVLHDPKRTMIASNKAFFSLFKELIYSLYPLAKQDADLHYYFIELTTSNDAFEPQNRATCERLIREITTLKPLKNTKNLKQYEQTLQYLHELTEFYYPKACDETAIAIAKQARLHVKTLLSQPGIKAYFEDLSHNVANISPKISPGLMHDALKYQGPSPNISRDFYSRRHTMNFSSGYRDLDGNQIVEPSTQETFLDKTIKTGGAFLAFIHRYKTPLSLLTQPFAQAFIAGHQTYRTQDENKLFKTILHGTGGFFYGLGLGASQALSSIPKAIYSSWFAPSLPNEIKAQHTLAISAAPGNEPGLHIQAMMDIRDHLLQLMATASPEFSYAKLITRLLAHVKKIHPSLLARETKEADYQDILTKKFPLNTSEWSHLFEPVIDTGNNTFLEELLNQHRLQIDNVFIYALYECLTSPSFEKAAKKVLQSVVEKYKLKHPQDDALASFVNYYFQDAQAKERDLTQYRFHGRALRKLKEKEQYLRKIQIWIQQGLDIQWGLETLLAYSIHQYRIQLNTKTLPIIVSELPDSMKEILYELICKPGKEKRTLNEYELDEPQKEFLLECSHCYKTISSTIDQNNLLEQMRKNERNDSSLSIKDREHLKLTQFIKHEWRHQLLPMDAIEAILDEIKQQIVPSSYDAVDRLNQSYEAALKNIKSPQAFDNFYEIATQIQRDHLIESPLHEWVNVTMNRFLNLLLDEMTGECGEPINLFENSQAIMHWLKHLTTQRQGIRALLAQQIEQAHSLDKAAWRCQHILHAVETLHLSKEHIRGTGMQKLLRLICQNTHTIVTPTGQEEAKKIPIAALCQYSITMQRALKRVKEKIPSEDFVRPIKVF